MIDYIYDRQEELVAWAQSRNTALNFRPDVKAIGVAYDGELRAVSTFDNFAVNDCLIGITSDGSKRWFTRAFGVRTMAYPFIQCKLMRVTALISRNNKASVRFIRGFDKGFVLEGVLREAGLNGEDMLIYGCLRRDCRWLVSMPDMSMAV